MALTAKVGAADVARATDSSEWGARWRAESQSGWTACRVLDVTLSGAVLELAGTAAAQAPVGETCYLQIDSIAEDDVGITMRAVVVGGERGCVELEFDARREERLLLHLLVRLHAVV